MYPKISITLNSFVRRTDHTQALKNLIRNSGAQLQRKGRSRNWELEVSSEQAIQLRNAIEASREVTWHWIEKALTAHVPALTLSQVNTIAQQHWPVTVTQLTILTNCTMAEARAVIDSIEWEQ